MMYTHNKAALQQVGNLLIAWSMCWKVALMQKVCVEMELNAAEGDFEGSVWSHEAAVRSGLVHAKGKRSKIQHLQLSRGSKTWHLGLMRGVKVALGRLASIQQCFVLVLFLLQWV